MTGFDSAIHSYVPLLFGMAPVPVTHTVHLIIAKRNFLGLRFQTPKLVFAPVAVA
jgi:hypothetical protein